MAWLGESWREPLAEWSRARRLPIAGGVVLCLAVMGVLGFWWFRGYRAGQLAEQARELASANELAEAWEKVRAARELRPDELGIARAAARIAEKVDTSAAMKLWTEARILSGGSAEDIEGQIRVVLALKDWAKADELLNELRAVAGESAHYLILRARWHAGQGERLAAMRIASNLLARDEVEPESHWFFVRTAMASPRASDHRRARRHLRDLALSRSDQSLAREALRRFSELPNLSEADRHFAIRRWEDLAATREDHLLALELRLAQPGDERASIVRKATALFDLEQEEERLALGRWFNEQGLYTATLELISEEASLERRDFFLVRLDALAMLDRWSEVNAVLGTRRVPLHGYLEELFRMRSYYEMGNMERASVAWSRALREARRNPTELRFLSRYTEQLGLYEFTIEALRAIVEQPGLKREGYESLLAIYERRKESMKVLSVLTAMRADFPNDFAVANDWAYYSLMLGRNIEEATTLIHELIELNPDLLAHRMTLVMAHLRNDNAEEALRLVESLPVPDWTKIGSARWRALLAVVLARNGRFDDAQRALAGIDSDQLMPEEAAMVSAAMR